MLIVGIMPGGRRSEAVMNGFMRGAEREGASRVALYLRSRLMKSRGQSWSLSSAESKVFGQ